MAEKPMKIWKLAKGMMLKLPKSWKFEASDKATSKLNDDDIKILFFIPTF